MKRKKSIDDFSIDKSGWKKVRFGDVAFEPKESIQLPNFEDVECVVGLEHLDKDDMRIRRSDSIENSTTFTKKFEAGDVLFGRRRAYLKKAAKAEFTGVCSGDIIVMRAKDGLLNELLPFIVNNDNFFDYSITHSAGGLSPRVKFKDLANYELFLPTIDEQKGLVELLFSINDAVEAQRHLLEKLKVANLAKQKSIFSNSSFEEKYIMDVAHVRRGKFTPRPRNDPRFFGGDIPFIQTAEVIRAKTYIEEYTQTLNEEGLSVSKMFPAGTIVMVIAGTYTGSCGVLSFDSAFTDSLVGLTSNEKILNQLYLFYFMRFNERGIDLLATEVAQRNLSIDSFQHFKVSYPSEKEVQDHIVNKIQVMDKSEKEANLHFFHTISLLKRLVGEMF
jgi:type I restriction enzyme S subunit